MDTFQPPPPLLPDLVTSQTHPNDLVMTDTTSSTNSSAWPPATPCSTSSSFAMQPTTTFTEDPPQTTCLPVVPQSPPQPATFNHFGHPQIAQPQQLPDIRPDEVVGEFEKIMRDENDRIVLLNSICLLYRFSIDNSYGFEVCQGLSESPIIKDRLCFVLTDERFKDDDTLLYYATGNLANISKYDEGRVAILTFNGIHNNYQSQTSLAMRSLFHSLQSKDIIAVQFAIHAIRNLLLDRRHTIQELAKKQISYGLSSIVQLLDKPCFTHHYKFLVTVLDCLQILAYGNNDNKLAIKKSRGSELLIRTIDLNIDNDELIETAALVLKSLSACPENKFDILEFGGISTLTKCLTKNNQEILNTCLWTLRYLSNVINDSPSVDNDCIQRLVGMLFDILKRYSEEPQTLIIALGVLANLTCNNEAIKLFICAHNGIHLLLETIDIAMRDGHDDKTIVETLEPAVRALSHLMNQNPIENQNIDDIAWIIRSLEASHLMGCDDLANAVYKLKSLVRPYLTTF